MNNRSYTITGHMVVKNEDRWIWFSIMSVINYLDKLIIYDTGSIDKTKEIVSFIKADTKYGSKIEYAELGSVSIEEFHKIRQKQIDKTETDYFMVIDGDEIWYQKSLEELDCIIEKQKPDLVATHFINCCGDIYHYRYDERESYCINGVTGSLTIRVYSMRIPGIHCGGDYGVEGYIDCKGCAVQEAGYSIVMMQGKYLHTSLLNRSSAQNGDFSIKYRRKKLSAIWDERFPKDFIYPEVFYWDIPQVVKKPFSKEFNIIRFFYAIKKCLIRMIK